MACVLFPNQHERKIAVSEVISLMESDTSMGPKFYPEASPGDAGKANDLS